MILIPIRTEMVSRRTPQANYVVLALNLGVFLVFNIFGRERLAGFRDAHLVLHAEWPALYQFITYQFLHADGWHLGGNMLFLWVFGNSVNVKLGDLPYLLFYLAGGVFAAVAFTVSSETGALLGASGAIAAVTTAYLALFPRSHVTVLFIFFFITFFEVPAMILIGIKVILWDNLIAPGFGGAGNVAYEAHWGGYLFGFVAAMVMLMLKLVPRDHFDMLALLDRWNRRRAYQAALADPDTRRQVELGTVARKIPQSEAERKAIEDRFDRLADLRTRISDAAERGDLVAASDLYEELCNIDPGQCLSAGHQLAVARNFYENNRYPQAAKAFERYLTCYREGAELEEIRLLLGIIYARDLKQFEAAEKHLAACCERLKGGERRRQCVEWLELARRALGKPVTDA